MSATPALGPTEHLVPTPHGEGRLVVHRPGEGVALSATLLLSHGAGGGIEARDLAALARDLPAEGFAVVLFEQPWRRAGRKVATRPASLDAGLAAARSALAELTELAGSAELADLAGLPLVVGGRSAGARSAARSAVGLGAVGCLALSFPLHPPGRPERSRLAELEGLAGLATLVVQGERDPMGRPEEFPAPLPPGVDLAVVPAADHGLAVGRTAPLSQDDALAVVVESVLEWLVREIVGCPRRADGVAGERGNAPGA
ncbi:alpha/beta family hydrolase [Nocardioides sp.]|uniref:alpha/beta hydrolase family protein n=1 Tax=Nocardioides sp. TaxID=35761 RepID=UPI00351761D4